MKIQHIALITIAVGVALVAVPLLTASKQPSGTWNPKVTQPPLKSTDGANPYKDAIQSSYEMTGESLKSIDDTYGQPQPKIKIKIEIQDASKPQS